MAGNARSPTIICNDSVSNRTAAKRKQVLIYFDIERIKKTDEIKVKQRGKFPTEVEHFQEQNLSLYSQAMNPVLFQYVSGASQSPSDQMTSGSYAFTISISSGRAFACNVTKAKHPNYAKASQSQRPWY